MDGKIFAKLNKTASKLYGGIYSIFDSYVDCVGLDKTKEFLNEEKAFWYGVSLYFNIIDKQPADFNIFNLMAEGIDRIVEFALGSLEPDGDDIKKINELLGEMENVMLKYHPEIEDVLRYSHA